MPVISRQHADGVIVVGFIFDCAEPGVDQRQSDKHSQSCSIPPFQFFDLIAHANAVGMAVQSFGSKWPLRMRRVHVGGWLAFEIAGKTDLNLSPGHAFDVKRKFENHLPVVTPLMAANRPGM